MSRFRRIECEMCGREIVDRIRFEHKQAQSWDNVVYKELCKPCLERQPLKHLILGRHRPVIIIQ